MCAGKVVLIKGSEAMSNDATRGRWHSKIGPIVRFCVRFLLKVMSRVLPAFLSGMLHSNIHTHFHPRKLASVHRLSKIARISLFSTAPSSSPRSPPSCHSSDASLPILPQLACSQKQRARYQAIFAFGTPSKPLLPVIASCITLRHVQSPEVQHNNTGSEW